MTDRPRIDASEAWFDVDAEVRRHERLSSQIHGPGGLIDRVMQRHEMKKVVSDTADASLPTFQLRMKHYRMVREALGDESTTVVEHKRSIADLMQGHHRHQETKMKIDKDVNEWAEHLSEVATSSYSELDQRLQQITVQEDDAQIWMTNHAQVADEVNQTVSKLDGAVTEFDVMTTKARAKYGLKAGAGVKIMRAAAVLTDLSIPCSSVKQEGDEKEADGVRGTDDAGHEHSDAQAYIAGGFNAQLQQLVDAEQRLAKRNEALIRTMTQKERLARRRDIETTQSKAKQAALEAYISSLKEYIDALVTGQGFTQLWDLRESDTALTDFLNTSLQMALDTAQKKLTSSSDFDVSFTDAQSMSAVLDADSQSMALARGKAEFEMREQQLQNRIAELERMQHDSDEVISANTVKLLDYEGRVRDLQAEVKQRDTTIEGLERDLRTTKLQASALEDASAAFEKARLSERLNAEKAFNSAKTQAVQHETTDLQTKLGGALQRIAELEGSLAASNDKMAFQQEELNIMHSRMNLMEKYVVPAIIHCGEHMKTLRKFLLKYDDESKMEDLRKQAWAITCDTFAALAVLKTAHEVESFPDVLEMSTGAAIEARMIAVTPTVPDSRRIASEREVENLLSSVRELKGVVHDKTDEINALQNQKKCYFSTVKAAMKDIVDKAQTGELLEFDPIDIGSAEEEQELFSVLTGVQFDVQCEIKRHSHATDKLTKVVIETQHNLLSQLDNKHELTWSAVKATDDVLKALRYSASSSVASLKTAAECFGETLKESLTPREYTAVMEKYDAITGSQLRKTLSVVRKMATNRIRRKKVLAAVTKRIATLGGFYQCTQEVFDAKMQLLESDFHACRRHMALQVELLGQQTQRIEQCNSVALQYESAMLKKDVNVGSKLLEKHRQLQDAEGRVGDLSVKVAQLEGALDEERAAGASVRQQVEHLEAEKRELQKSASAAEKDHRAKELKKEKLEARTGHTRGRRDTIMSTPQTPKKAPPGTWDRGASRHDAGVSAVVEKHDASSVAVVETREASAATVPFTTTSRLPPPTQSLKETSTQTVGEDIPPSTTPATRGTPVAASSKPASGGHTAAPATATTASPGASKQSQDVADSRPAKQTPAAVPRQPDSQQAQPEVQKGVSPSRRGMGVSVAQCAVQTEQEQTSAEASPRDLSSKTVEDVVEQRIRSYVHQLEDAEGAIDELKRQVSEKDAQLARKATEINSISERLAAVADTSQSVGETLVGAVVAQLPSFVRENEYRLEDLPDLSAVVVEMVQSMKRTKTEAGAAPLPQQVPRCNRPAQTDVPDIVAAGAQTAEVKRTNMGIQVRPTADQQAVEREKHAKQLAALKRDFQAEVQKRDDILVKLKNELNAQKATSQKLMGQLVVTGSPRDQLAVVTKSVYTSTIDDDIMEVDWSAKPRSAFLPPGSLKFESTQTDNYLLTDYVAKLKALPPPIDTSSSMVQRQRLVAEQSAIDDVRTTHRTPADLPTTRSFGARPGTATRHLPGPYVDPPRSMERSVTVAYLEQLHATQEYRALHESPRCRVTSASRLDFPPVLEQVRREPLGEQLLYTPLRHRTDTQQSPERAAETLEDLILVNRVASAKERSRLISRGRVIQKKKEVEEETELRTRNRKLLHRSLHCSSPPQRKVDDQSTIKPTQRAGVFSELRPRPEGIVRQSSAPRKNSKRDILAALSKPFPVSKPGR